MELVPRAHSYVLPVVVPILSQIGSAANNYNIIIVNTIIILKPKHNVKRPEMQEDNLNQQVYVK